LSQGRSLRSGEKIGQENQLMVVFATGDAGTLCQQCKTGLLHFPNIFESENNCFASETAGVMGFLASHDGS
jgi:hypothetical protein